MLLGNKAEKIQLTPEITLVRANFEDPKIMDFLCQVYKSTRTEEMAACGWSDPQSDLFLTQQFQFQHRDYTSRYQTGFFYLIHWAEKPCGRIYIDHGQGEIRVIDIALFPEFRSRGLATQIFSILKTEARKLDIPITLHVAVFNRCQRLYERLGFIPGTSDGVYTFMRFAPETGLKPVGH